MSLLPGMVESQTYGNVLIPHTDRKELLEKTYSFYTEGSTEPGTVINIQADATRLMSGPEFPSEYMTELTNWRTEEEQQEDIYIAAINFMHEHVSFVCGDLEHGGIFFFKFNGAIHFGVCEGYFQRPGEGSVETAYTFLISFHTYSQDGIQPANTDEVMISFTEESDLQVSNYPSFYVYAKRAGSLVSKRDLDYSVVELPQYGPEVGVATLQEAVSNPLWYEPLIGDGLPIRVWDDCIVQTMFFQGPPQGGVLIGGDWSGMTSIDLSMYPDWKGGLSQPEGDPGDFPTRSDRDGLTDPNGSGIDACNSGFVTLYNPTFREIQLFNNFLFSDSITDAMATALKKLIADPIDYLVFIAMVRFKPPTPSPLLEEIRFCGISSGVNARVIKPQALQLKYLPLTIERASKGFKDYNPYSHASIHLPYIGWKELNVDDIMGSTLKVSYNIDCLTGSCVAQINVTREARDYLGGLGPDAPIERNLYEFTGNCFEMLPLNATDFRGLFGSIMQTAVGVGASLATGNPLGAGAALINGASSAKVNVEHSGNMSASAGYFSDQKVYIKLDRPIQSEPVNYANRRGMPSNIFINQISRLIGYGYCEFEPESLVLDSLTDASLGEIEEIRSLLSGGMIF